jgi:Arc/MetJ-type ribon-helix-helix transcriptional regulator
MPDRKDKMVSFRLSQEEYEQLQKACGERGVRNVSDLARSAMRTLLGHETGRDALVGQVEELRQRVTELSRELDRLSAKSL